MTNHKAVRERSHLQVVTDTGHWTTLRNDVAEVVEQIENLLLGESLTVLLLDTGKLLCQTIVHLLGRRLVDVTGRILQCILANPHSSSQFVTSEVLLRGSDSIVVLDFFKSRVVLHYRIYFLVIVPYWVEIPSLKGGSIREFQRYKDRTFLSIPSNKFRYVIDRLLTIFFDPFSTRTGGGFWEF